MKSIQTIAAIAMSSTLAFGCATLELSSPSATSAGAQATSTLRNVALIMGEPNFSVDGAYQELEEGLYTKPALRQGKKVFAPLQEIIPYLGGEYAYDEETKSASYKLAGHVVKVAVGDTNATLDDSAVVTDVAPELIDGSVWVSASWVFQQLGGYVKWEESRQRLSATFILPLTKKLEDFARGGPVTESTMTTQPPEFYLSAEGRKLADVVASYQNKDGGWPKLETNVNMLVPINTSHLTGFKAKSTIDNDSTTKQVIVLARAYTTFKDNKYRDGFYRGLNYLLAAQLPNGGWQQFWPEPAGYKKRITFNDDAIANVLEILRDVANKESIYAFVDAAHVTKSNAAFHKGLELILKTQLVVGGKKTAWCSQYDEKTLAPAMGRAFELESISGHESVNVVKFLMSLEKPSPEIIQAVQDAITWFDAAKITGYKLERKEDRTLELGFDRRVVADPKAPPMWARFYDVTTGKPLFTARDGIKRSDYADVTYERRVKYNWYTDAPRQLLEKDYPAWQKKWAPNKNVLVK